MNIVLIAKFWREVMIIALSVLLVIAVLAYKHRSALNDTNTANCEIRITQQAAAHESANRKLESENYEKTLVAINQAKEREREIIADANLARDTVASLSNTIDTLAANAKTDAKFRDSYIATTGQLLKTCSSEYIGMAKTADLIANDLRMIQQANNR